MLVRVIICLGSIAVLAFVRPDFRAPMDTLQRQLALLRGPLMEILFALAQISLFVCLIAYLLWPVMQDLGALLRKRRVRTISPAQQRLRSALGERPELERPDRT
jgi:hypothetical protein